METFLEASLFYIWLVFFFVLGAVVGSFLNVCVYRIPYEKSIVWPSSRCGHCLTPVGWANIPLVSFWLLRGRCRHCGARFSVRYFLVELLCALAFPGLFLLEIVCNVQGVPYFHLWHEYILLGAVPPSALAFFAFHAALLCLLLVVTFTDLDHLEIPLSVTVTGMAIGLVGAMLLPWPWPSGQPGWTLTPPDMIALGSPGQTPRPGLYPCPLWYPMPAWLPAGSWQAGLLTGLAGMLAGQLLRLVGVLYKLGRGREGMGLGDSDLMMMVGCFLGWQPVLVAFVISLIPGLLFGFVQLFRHGDRPFPFGPSLAIGTVITWLGWGWIGPRVLPYCYNSTLLTMAGIAGPVFLLLACLLLRLGGRGEEPTGMVPVPSAGPGQSE